MKNILMKYLLNIILLLIFTFDTSADTINIPADQSTIQAGIDASASGDTVLVAPGTYVENIRIRGKSITIGSHFITTNNTSYVYETIIDGIDGGGNGSVCSIHGNDNSKTLLCGFVITNGAARNGGGIYCSDSTLRLSHLFITGNTAETEYGRGGGICCYDSDIVISDVTVANNISNLLGGGIYCYNSTVKVSNASINENIAVEGGGIYFEEFSDIVLTNVNISENFANKKGGGISCMSNTYVKMTNCTIVDNNVENDKEYTSGGGIYTEYRCEVELINVTIANNESGEYSSAIGHYSEKSLSLVNCIVARNKGKSCISKKGKLPSISYSNFWNNEYGDNEYWIGDNVAINANGYPCDLYNNIQLNPAFINVTEGDYRISRCSFAIGAGIQDSAPEYDILGNLRGTPPDMGAYENALDKPDRSNIIVQGYAFLENQTNHSGISVSIVNTITSEKTGSSITESDGSYVFEIEPDLYNFVYEKEGFFIKNQSDMGLYENKMVENVTLYKYTHLVHVPSIVPSIQEAINYVFPGDTVLVAPGTYVENINFNGKNIVVGSLFITTQDTSFISQTVIDNDDRIKGVGVVNFSDCEDSTTVLTGFTITGGTITEYYDNNKVGVSCINSSPILKNIVVKKNINGIHCTNSNPIISNTFIYNNLKTELVCVDNSNPQLKNVIVGGIGNCKFEVGSTMYSAYGGISCTNNSSPVLTDVEIYCKPGFGLSCSSNSNPILNRVKIEEVGKVGIKCNTSSPSIKNVTIKNIHMGHSSKANAIVCNNSSPYIENAIIKNISNYSIMLSSCATIKCSDHSYPTIINLIISGNINPGDSFVGISSLDHSNPTLINMTIANNHTNYCNNDHSYGIYCEENSSCTVINSVITDNAYGIFNNGGNIFISNSNVWGNISLRDNTGADLTGLDENICLMTKNNINGDPCDEFFNISMNPLFKGEEDFHLLYNSPCINAGTADGALEYDIENTIRLSLPDMGAYENPNVILKVEQENIPKTFYLYPCSPNPFNPSTIISYSLSEASFVRLFIFDINGQKVDEIVSGYREVGKYEVKWNPIDFASGLYFCRLEAGDNFQTRKMLLLK